MIATKKELLIAAAGALAIGATATLVSNRRLIKNKRFTAARKTIGKTLAKISKKYGIRYTILDYPEEGAFAYHSLTGHFYYLKKHPQKNLVQQCVIIEPEYSLGEDEDEEYFFDDEFPC